MKIIEKIEIHRFRSVSDVSINSGNITIFSGLNNSGKSNVLRALNLFFNSKSNSGQEYDFQKDYNKAYTGKAGGKREIKITLYFNPQGDAALKSPFSISRTFQLGRPDSDLEYRSNDPSIQNSIVKKDGNITRQFTRFLNKIEYFYIPAVRDRDFVRSLFLHFEKLIEHNSGSDFKDKMEELSKVLQTNSREISIDFEKFIGLPTRADLSSKITDILGTVEVNVKTGIKVQKKNNKEWEDVFINLFSSGDGILMSYLAYFLGHICKKISNKNFIWGFEEPENSLEYSKVQKLAEDFVNEFGNSAQIYITTHSPAFIKLKDKTGVVFYRVYINPDNPKQSSEIRTLKEIDSTQNTLFNMGRVDTTEYKKLVDELKLVEFAQEIENAVRKINDETKMLTDAKTKFEDKYRSLLQTHPVKVFICEDSATKTIKLWRKWLNFFDLEDVQIISSEGCTTRVVEDWAYTQQKLDSSYKPKIFREIDKDGLTDKQIKVLVNKKYKNKDLLYKVEFLPVYEIENFAVLKEPKFNVKFWKIHKDSVIKDFELKTSLKSKLIDKYLDYKDKNFRGVNGNYTEIMQKMRTIALANWKKSFSGKEMYKKMTNFDPNSHLNSLSKNNLPRDLTLYLESIKIFYES